jgi:DnaK suppressor protein
MEIIMSLSKEKIEKFKTHFLSQHEKIVKTSSARADDETDTGGDEADQVSMRQIKSLTDSLSAREKASITRIENCLLKIAHGTFGRCEDCEELISEARLNAIPDCELCISCAEQLELDRKKGIL